MRKNISKQDFRKLRGMLTEISKQKELTPVEKFSRSIDLVNDFLNEVRMQVTTVAFKDKFEEIYFFKFEKPEYYALKIYQVALFTLINGKPVGTSDMIRTYFEEELAYISRFFRQYAFYYQYYRSGFTEMDETLFLRESRLVSPVFIELPELDTDFCTGGDYLFAKFIAYELLQEYILDQIQQLDTNGRVMMADMTSGKKWFDWTGEVVNLVELGYALYAAKQIGNGKTSLGEICRWLEESFGVEIGIPANRFREIKRRKRISRTHFLELLINDLLNYMDGDQEKD